MNLNKKIQKFSGDGIPEYNKRINELIEAANWLLGVRTINGKVIAESDQGPIIDLSQVNSTQTSDASQTAPNGDRAGWLAITAFNSGANNLIDFYTWASNAYNQRPAPWLTDPDGIAAQWVQHDVCVNGQVVSKWFWGTP